MANPWVYFKPEEVEGLDTELVAKLDQARHYAGTPFKITSGKRSVEDNQKLIDPNGGGAVEDSAHLKGLAVDLEVLDSSARFAIVKGLILAGFTRIGVYSAHVHADTDPDKPQSVLWTGISH